MPIESLITTRTLYKYRRIRKTFGENFTADVIKSNAMPNHSSTRFALARSIDVRQRTQTKSIRCIRIAETVDNKRIQRRMERLPNTLIQFVVKDRTPERRFDVGHRCRRYVAVGISWRRCHRFEIVLHTLRTSDRTLLLLWINRRQTVHGVDLLKTFARCRIEHRPIGNRNMNRRNN